MTDFDNVTISDTLTMKAQSPHQTYDTKIKTVWVTFPTEAPILRIAQGIWGNERLLLSRISRLC